MNRLSSARRQGLLIRLLLLSAMLICLASCSPYAGIDIGVPFKVGPVYVNPSIGVGGFL
jgi:hypothetical protein